MNLYTVKTIASISETKVRISLQSVILIPIAEPLATPTCIVSFRLVIFICFRLLIQVGFQLSYIYYFWFVAFLHYVKSGVKKFLKVNLLPCLCVSRFMPL